MSCRSRSRVARRDLRLSLEPLQVRARKSRSAAARLGLRLLVDDNDRAVDRSEVIAHERSCCNQCSGAARVEVLVAPRTRVYDRCTVVVVSA
jgi:hypothetical protein